MNRSLQLVFVLCVASLVPVRARTGATTTVLCKDGTTAMGGRGACHGHGGVDKTGGAPTAAAPAEEHEAGAGGVVTCKDGSTATRGRGACHGHGGVDKTAGGAPKAAAPAEEHEASAGGPVTCKDGSTWPKSGRGACRGHGGVLKAGEAPTPPPVPRAAAPKPPPPPPPSAPVARGNAAAGPAVATKSKHASNDPTGALARCKDGMYWHGTRHSGSCSRHGGVAEWLQGPS